MRFAYADPPYLGLASYYDHPESGLWDLPETHRQLFLRLQSEFSDGWAYSLYTNSLQKILPLAPEGVRVAAWVKPFVSFKPGVNPAYAWEPVLFMGGRKRGRAQDTVRDWHASSITRQKGLTGAKPESFCRWILDLLGYEDGDEIVDLFPGTGVMGRVLSQGKLKFG